MPTEQSIQASRHSSALPQLLSGLAQEDLQVKLHLWARFEQWGEK